MEESEGLKVQKKLRGGRGGRGGLHDRRGVL